MTKKAKEKAMCHLGLWGCNALKVNPRVQCGQRNIMAIYTISTNFIKSRMIHISLVLLGFELGPKHQGIQMI